MSAVLLKDILNDWSGYELDDSIYLPVGNEASLDLQAEVLPFDSLRKRGFGSLEYWLGVEQLRNVVDGLQHQLQREATPEERLKAVAHFAKFDAYIDPGAL